VISPIAKLQIGLLHSRSEGHLITDQVRAFADAKSQFSFSDHRISVESVRNDQECLALMRLIIEQNTVMLAASRNAIGWSRRAIATLDGWRSGNPPTKSPVEQLADHPIRSDPDIQLFG
jgi:hypothetical protein